VRLSEYRPEDFEALLSAAPSFGASSTLGHRSFVDYYYASRPWSRLFLLRDEGEAVCGTIGIDQMRFEADARELSLGFGNNFNALQAGAGGLLFMHWLKTAGTGIVFGGSVHTHKITRARKWTYAPDVPLYALNPDYARVHGEPAWRRALKAVLRRVGRRPLGRYAGRLQASVRAGISVREEPDYAADLLPRASPFAFRFAPSLEYLTWRYATRLPFVRYRLFRILRNEASAGFVVINESAARLIVAHGDADEAETLAHGTLGALLQVAGRDVEPRSVLLASMHPHMQRVFHAFGFRRAGARALAVGTLKGPAPLPPDPGAYLVNFDWGDNGLRRPFLDEA
jgi:hypothetical protein